MSHEELVRELNVYFDEKLTEYSPDDQFDVEKARAMSLAYAARWRHDGYKVRGIEVSFDLPLIDPETGKQLEYEGRDILGNTVVKKATYCGYIDLIMELADGTLWFADHKTANRLMPMYWEALKTDPQITHYMLAGRQCRIPNLRGFIYDVIVKPSIKPTLNKSITKKLLKEMEEQGTYCGLPYDGWHPDMKYENKDMFGIRCLTKMVDGDYFHRRRIFRTDEQIMAYLKGLCAAQRQIGEVELREDMRLMTPKACTDYGSLCDFHPICAGETSKLTHPFRKKRSSQTERATGPESLSVSRVKLFQQCKAKFAFEKVDRIERADKKEPKHLIIGTLFHEAVEKFCDQRAQNLVTNLSELSA